ncbi:MAG: hypothetical protein IPG75_20820 [Gemmatimonadetes bacterium]|nr:hypothetical protein [Gemmatimonadota bacterium]
MSDDWNKHVFGISAKKPPRLVLLDEVHTYSGVHGAQVALLLRRYRHAVGRELQFTGLSATLRNAGEFFAQLTGLRSGAVQEIAPISEETQREGMEYLLALRGDPVSQASLLSTTIQTSMLVRRLLDPAPSAGQSSGEGSGLYGRRVFVFTDDLDVTNRLYHNLLDAEGLNDQGRPRNGRGTLAQFRSSGQPFQNERMRAGQSWYLCEEIGHPQGIDQPLKVGRTSSQDTGVEKDGDIIVATASLEVGFNDPEVGAVIQHKAPHDFASYLQRKGRAGRLRSMRPWTVVVLSDFGRDRLAYQGYEGLLDPLVPPRTLPVANRYVLRIQATYAFLEWMAKQLAHCEGKGNVYYDFAQPSSTTTGKSRQARAAAIIGDLLSAGGDRERALLDHLMKSLQISKNEAQAVMWEGPRALMLHVLPTLMRRLETGWQRRPLAGEGGIESTPRIHCRSSCLRPSSVTSVYLR